jgi:hypothetical protein
VSEPENISLKPCIKFKGMPTNGDVCYYWGKSFPLWGGDGPGKIIPGCRLDIECPNLGQRVTRPYEKTDTEEDSFE